MSGRHSTKRPRVADLIATSKQEDRRSSVGQPTSPSAEDDVAVRYERVCNSGEFCIVRVKTDTDPNADRRDSSSVDSQLEDTVTLLDTDESGDHQIYVKLRNRPNRNRKRHETGAIKLPNIERLPSINDSSRSKRLKELLDPLKPIENLIEF